MTSNNSKTAAAVLVQITFHDINVPRSTSNRVVSWYSHPDDRVFEVQVKELADREVNLYAS